MSIGVSLRAFHLKEIEFLGAHRRDRQVREAVRTSSP